MNIVRTNRINHPPRSRQRNPLRCLLLVLGLLGGLADAVHAAEATQSAAVPPPLQIDLDAFDARKKTVALPNGEVTGVHRHGQCSGSSGGAHSRLHRQRTRLGAHASVPVEGPSADPRGYPRSWTIEQTGVLLYPARLRLRHQALAGCARRPEGRHRRALARQHHCANLRRILAGADVARRVDRLDRRSSPQCTAEAAQFDFAAEIRKLKEPIEPDSPFMIAWWDSPTPVDPDFIRRQRKDAAGIPLRVWLAVLDQGLPDNAVRRSAKDAAASQGPDPAHLGQQGSHHGGTREQDPARCAARRQSERFSMVSATIPFGKTPGAWREVINAFLAG